MICLGCASSSYGIYEMRSILFLGGIYPDSLLVEGRFVLTALQGCQSSVELIDRKAPVAPHSDLRPLYIDAVLSLVSES
jgi:hypothetical protein